MQLSSHGMTRKCVCAHVRPARPVWMSEGGGRHIYILVCSLHSVTSSCDAPRPLFTDLPFLILKSPCSAAWSRAIERPGGGGGGLGATRGSPVCNRLSDGERGVKTLGALFPAATLLQLKTQFGAPTATCSLEAARCKYCIEIVFPEHFFRLLHKTHSSTKSFVRCGGGQILTMPCHFDKTEQLIFKHYNYWNGFTEQTGFCSPASCGKFRNDPNCPPQR